MLIENAFTLTEVLITLLFMSIVAALTIPSLVQKYREKATVARVKESYAIFQQALKLVAIDYPNLMDLTDKNLTPKENSRTMFNEISKYLKKVKSCDVDTNCMSSTYVNLNDEPLQSAWDDFTNIQTGVLANGTAFWILSLPYRDVSKGVRDYSAYNGQIGIDINGNDKPNKLGVDFFWFTFNSEGNLTAGINPLNSLTPAGEYNNCELGGERISIYNGYGCSEWILKYGNMDYLKKNIRKSKSEE